MLVPFDDSRRALHIYYQILSYYRLDRVVEGFVASVGAVSNFNVILNTLLLRESERNNMCQTLDKRNLIVDSHHPLCGERE